MTPNVPEPPPGRGPEDRRRAETNFDPKVFGGGADAVEKTTYVGPRDSADPNAHEEVKAPVPAGRGVGTFGWLAIVLLVIVLLVYLAGIF